MTATGRPLAFPADNGMPMRRSPNLWRETTPRQLAVWVLIASGVMLFIDLIVPH